jgi:hypothetical protein
MRRDPRHNGRHAIAKDLTKGAIMMPVAMGGTLTMAVIRARSLETDFAQAVHVRAARRRNAFRDRRNGLNSQRQNEEKSGEPPAGHEGTA